MGEPYELENIIEDNDDIDDIENDEEYNYNIIDEDHHPDINMDDVREADNKKANADNEDNEDNEDNKNEHNKNEDNNNEEVKMENSHSLDNDDQSNETIDFNELNESKTNQ